MADIDQNLPPHNALILQEAESSKESGWEFYPSSLPEKRISISCLERLEEESLKWYVEEYAVKTPYEKDRAARVRGQLALQSQKIYASILAALDTWKENETLLHICEHDVETSTFHKIHWELAESRVSTDASRTIQVSRIIKSEKATWEAWTRDWEYLLKSDTFNILLVVSRPEGLESGHDIPNRLISKLFFDLIQSLPEGTVTIELVRPGTWRGLIDHLKNAEKRGKFFHLVHFDVHGVTSEPGINNASKSSLLFFDSSLSGEEGAIPARNVARLLRKFHIPCAVLNACESARGDLCGQGNLAKVLVRGGIPLVIGMAYKLTDSAAAQYVITFYIKLLVERHLFSTSAFEGRCHLRKYQIRRGRFGIPVELEDWMVPVTYMSMDKTFEEKLRLMMPKIEGWTNSSKFINISETDEKEFFETDLLRAETLMLTGKKNMLLVQGDLGVGRTTFFEAATCWWLKTGFARYIYHIKFPDQKGLLPQVALAQPSYRFTGEHIMCESANGKGYPSFEKIFDSIAKFESMHKVLEEMHGSRPTVAEAIFIMDGICPFVTNGTEALPHTGILGMLRQALEEENAYVIVGSYSNLSWIQSALQDVSLMTLQLPVVTKMQDFKRFLKNPNQSKLLEGLFDWGLQVPSYVDLVRKMVNKFGLEDTQQILMSNSDVFSFLYEDEGLAKEAMKKLAGFKHAEKIFQMLSPADQERLIYLSHFTNAAPYEADEFVQAAKKRLKLRPKSRPKTSLQAAESVDDLMSYLSVFGLVRHEEYYHKPEWRPLTHEIARTKVLCKFHPALTLFLRSQLVTVGYENAFKLDDVFLSYQQQRLEGLASKRLPSPLASLSEGEPKLAKALFEIEKDKEIEWGFWNFKLALWIFVDDRNDRKAQNADYPHLFYHYFLEPSPLKYEHLHDKVLARAAASVIVTLCEISDHQIMTWYRFMKRIADKSPLGFHIERLPPMEDGDAHKLMEDFPRQYWRTFDALFGFSNWLCRALREQDNHIEFECWIKVLKRLLKTFERVLKRRRVELLLQDAECLGHISGQATAAEHLILLSRSFPNRSVQFDVTGEIEFQNGLLEFPELAPLATLTTQTSKVIRKDIRWGYSKPECVAKAYERINDDMGKNGYDVASAWLKFLSKLPGKYLFEVRAQGALPEDDGIPWPDELSEAMYKELQKVGMVTGMLTPFSWAFKQLRLNASWESIREEMSQKQREWYLVDLPKLWLKTMDMKMNAKILNLLQMQILQTTEEWTSCLVFLDQVRQEDDADSDKAVWELIRANCLQHLGEEFSAVSSALKCFEHCGRIQGQDNLTIERLKELYNLISGWPKPLRSQTQIVPEILLCALKIGYKATKYPLYARNGNLLKLLLSEIDSEVCQIEDTVDEDLELDNIVIPKSVVDEDEDWLEDIVTSVWSDQDFEMLRNCDDHKKGSTSIIGQVIEEEWQYDCVVGDLWRSFSNMESFILFTTNKCQSGLYLGPGFLERIMTAKGYTLKENENGSCWERTPRADETTYSTNNSSQALSLKQRLSSSFSKLQRWQHKFHLLLSARRETSVPSYPSSSSSSSSSSQVLPQPECATPGNNIDEVKGGDRVSARSENCMTPCLKQTKEAEIGEIHHLTALEVVETLLRSKKRHSPKRERTPSIEADGVPAEFLKYSVSYGADAMIVQLKKLLLTAPAKDRARIWVEAETRLMDADDPKSHHI